MFDFGNANEGQRLAISTADGPVLITAGPGTGKTFTLVQRAIYLIQECGVAPEQIMMATFTEKAAKELVTRITNELASRDIVVNVNEMYIGTFHSLCLRIIKEHLEFTRLKRNYRTLDAFDQNYTVFQNISRFRAIKDIDTLLPKGSWKMAQEICVYVNNLMEELVDPDALKTDGNPDIRILGNVLEAYKDILAENNLVDFASIQTEAYRLMKDNPEILKELQNRLQYIMIDEYQDTNYIQEQIVFLLAGDRQNICVVGDDDQGLYRFRGATIRNILEFPDKFPEGMCKIIPLVINYRSNSDIVDFYNKWMATTDGATFKFDWDKYRYQKKIEPHAKSTISSPAVAKLASVDDEDEWHEKILRFITGLKDSGKLTNYNQIAFLFSSVKHERVTRLAAFLETNHINVYSPRSDMFFGREEIKIALGTMMLLFPKYVIELENDEYPFLQPEHSRYYRDCILAANEFLTRPENAEFMKWVRHHGKVHVALKGTTDYTYSGLLYQMFEYEPFRSILGTDMTAGVVDVRPARNLALLSQVIGKYEYLHRIDVLNGKTINSNTEKFFNLYLRLLYDGGINEYEDDAEYAPSGCVSFLTIHQSKGMEFPIVVVDSLSSVPRKNSRDFDNESEIVTDTLFKQMKKYKEAYPNYIYALTMGLGKTILMATCIFYEFLLANKYPKDKRFCHNALVFAPDKTVLQSLREIITFDKTKVVPPEYARVLDANIKFHFLEETGTTLHTIDDSDFNIVISNTQKIIVKKKRKRYTLPECSQQTKEICLFNTMTLNLAVSGITTLTSWPSSKMVPIS